MFNLWDDQCKLANLFLYLDYPPGLCMLICSNLSFISLYTSREVESFSPDRELLIKISRSRVVSFVMNISILTGRIHASDM